MNSATASAARVRAVALALALGAGLTLTSTAYAQANAHPPERLTYQGFLVDGNGLPLGNSAPKNYDVIFRIYAEETGGAAVWSEQQTLTVDKGTFSVLLGEGTQVGSDVRPALSTLFKGATASDRWVAITVKGIGAGGANVDILPRMRLLSAPYAFLAEQATKLVREDNSADLITSSGNVLAFNGQLDVLGNNSLEFGVGLTKQSDAGRIGYQLFAPADSLDIVGAGTAANNRKVKIYAESGLNVTGPVTAPSFNGAHTGDGSALTGLPKLSGGNTFSGNQILNNRLGIGEASPDARLHVDDSNYVVGILESSSTIGTWLGLGNSSVGGRFWQMISTGSGNGEGAGKLLIGSGTTVGGTSIGMTLESGGDVGIGITDPTYKLHVNGSVAIQNGSVLQFGQGYTREVSAGQIGYGVHSGGASGSLDIVGAGTTGSNRKISMWAEGGAQLNGTLRVTGSASPFVLTEAFLYTTGAGDYPNLSLNWANGIVADYGIRAAVFTVASDRRIKNSLGQSDGKADLTTLKKIEITDYKYRDVVNYGTRAQKKVIAQQVEAVYPQAVSVTTGVVPDIYKKATSTNGWIQLQSDLKADDRVRVVSGKADRVHTVVAVENPQPGSREEPKFRLDPPVAEGNVFVYGREVKDFRAVDYEAIAMLNVSATQELARQLEQKEAELAALRDELARARGEKQSLAENLTAMDARLARLEKVLRTQAALAPESAETALVRVRN